MRDVPVLLALRSLRATLSARAVHLLEFVGSFFFSNFLCERIFSHFFPRGSLVKKCAVCFSPFSLTFRSFRKSFITSPPPFESERDLFFRRRLTTTDSNSGCSHKARKMEEGWVFARPFFPSLFWGRKSDTKTFHLKEKKFELD